MANMEQRVSNHFGSGDQYSDEIDRFGVAYMDESNVHPCDTDEARREHIKLLSWFYLERDRQAINRMEMALDCDCYDGIQWNEEDAAILRDRGQMPLVFNETAPIVDWLIGTERRTRVDWNVLPRTEDDVQSAKIKTDVLKYVSDINKVPFARSRAFADCIKAGVGWLDDGARDDPTQDILYSRYEDWRNVLWDSNSYELDLSDARYVIRWRWVDEDIAMMMVPGREKLIQTSMEETAAMPEHEEFYLGEPLYENLAGSGTISARGSSTFDAIHTSRKRVKLYEVQYRKPAQVRVVMDGPMKGSFLCEGDNALQDALIRNGYGLSDRIMMRVHIALFTEAGMLAYGPSNFRHNRFSLTPVWCYRRSRDRLPYGAIRRGRDIQYDINKRASKASWLVNTNQIITEKNAADDMDKLFEEAQRPDGVMELNANKRFEIRRDHAGANSQIEMLQLNTGSLQRLAGVADENMGRQTNAVSGEAIKARQLQGSVVTTEPFDNLRLAIQVQGQKQLSLVEQFYTEEKVIRLTGQKGRIEWLKINQPEQQPDGSVRYLNDITSSMADFIVSEQDYSGTLRQVMFEQMMQVASKFPPEMAVRFLRMAFEYSDMPNKDEIVNEIRRITGEQDPNKELTPEEAQAAQQQMQQQTEAMQMQRQTAINALDEQRAKIALVNAQAQEVMARIQTVGGNQETNGQMLQIQKEASDHIEALSEQLRKAQNELANRTLQIKSDADVKREIANIDADTKLRVAELTTASDDKIKAIQDALSKAVSALDEKIKQEAENAKAEVAKVQPAMKEAISAHAPAPVAPPAQPSMVFNVQNMTADNLTASAFNPQAVTVQEINAAEMTGALTVDSINAQNVNGDSLNTEVVEDKQVVLDKDANGKLTGKATVKVTRTKQIRKKAGE